jgi:3-hydroxyacyl-[acyl-carrier-protein] dehydratase
MLLVESVAQLSGILTITTKGEGGFLASIDRAEFTGTAQVGDTLTISARVIKSFGRLFMVAGEICCEDRTLLTVQMTLGAGKL